MKKGRVVVFVLLIILIVGVARNRSGNDDSGSVVPSETNVVSENISGLTPGEFERLDMNFEGLDRYAFIYLPKSLDDLSGARTVFVFHGGGGGGAEKVLEKMSDKISKLAEDSGTVFVVPSSYGGSPWSDGRDVTDNTNDVAFIKKLKSDLEVSYLLDPNKSYVTGVSSGGLFTQLVACEVPEVFSAYGVMIANLVVEVEPNCQGDLSKPMMFVHGSADKFMPFNGGSIKKSDVLGMGSGGEVLSADYTIEFWAGKLGCEDVPTQTRIENDPSDGTTAVHYVWESCREGSVLERYVIEGGGHTWLGTAQSGIADRLVGLAGNEVDAFTEIVSFFIEQEN